VADGVDAAVDPMQTPARRPLRHRRLAQALRIELGKGDHTMLPLGKLGNRDLPRGFVTKVNPWLTNVSSPLHGAQHAAKTQT
jgi:hypothetical protein